MTNEQKIYLAQSAEFQRLLADDPVLSELESQQYDPAAEFHSLMEIFCGLFTIGKATVQPLTPALWAFLWGIGNRYTTDIRKVTESDTDIFLFLLSNGIRKLNCMPAELPAVASGFCPAMGLDYITAAKEITAAINAAFRPYEMLPKVKGNPEPARYDAYWLVQLCSVVAQEANEPARNIIFDMPLSAANYYFVNYIRKNDPKTHVRRRSPAEIQKDIFERVNALSEEFIEKNYGGI